MKKRNSKMIMLATLTHNTHQLSQTPLKNKKAGSAKQWQPFSAVDPPKPSEQRATSRAVAQLLQEQITEYLSHSSKTADSFAQI